MIKLSKKNYKIVEESLNKFSKENLLTSEQCKLLKENVQIQSFDWGKLSKISFIVSIICVIISIQTLFANEYFFNLIKRLFIAPAIVKSLSLSLVSILFYCIAMNRKKTSPIKIYSNNAILLLATLSTASSVFYLGKAIDLGSGHYSLLLLLTSIIYGIIGISFPSVMVWVFSLLSWGGWLGAETGYWSQERSYYLGMNYPLRFLLFGLFLCSLSYNLKNFTLTKNLYKSTFNISMLYIFISLWILSLCGNSEIGSKYFHKPTQVELFFWSIIFAIAALIAIAHGLKDDTSSSGMYGITFLLINLYTKYFEYFWNSINKTIFFGILSISFWILATKSESILEILKKTKIVIFINIVVSVDV